MDKEQVFIHHKTYPNAADIFNMEVLPYEEIKDECIYVIDTNALLIPYATSSAGFEEIKKAYSQLINEKRLLVPGQVAREFAKNRPEKIKELFQQLNRIRNSIQKPKTGSYPLLETLGAYAEAVQLEQKVDEAQREYSKKMGELLDQVKQWRWNDPISQVYNELFDREVIYELEVDQDQVLKELELRNKYSIPPGFNDKKKEDHGIGDLLVWLTILDIAEKQQKHIVFISGDEKNDWFHKSEKQALYPRFELLAEFKNKTHSKSFHILRLSELLGKLGAKAQVVEEIETSESKALDFNEASLINDLPVYKAVFSWLIDTETDANFHSTSDQVSNIYESDEGEVVEVFHLSSVLSQMSKISFIYKAAKKTIEEGFCKSYRIVIVDSENHLTDKMQLSVLRHLIDMKYWTKKVKIVFGTIDTEGNFNPSLTSAL